jgi:hypothetical protein
MPEMVMPGTLIPETTELGKTIDRQELRMPVQTCRRRDIQEPVLQHQAGKMGVIPGWKGLVITEILWENE